MITIFGIIVIVSCNVVRTFLDLYIVLVAYNTKLIRYDKEDRDIGIGITWP